MREKQTDNPTKGNQLKWENNGIWYKADCTGYEGLAEYMISHLLKFSSLQKDEFVLYDYERIKYKNIFYNGVKSNNFYMMTGRLLRWSVCSTIFS